MALGGAAAPLSGCDPFDRDDGPAPEPDPLAPLLDEALRLAAAHAAAAAAHPALADRLTPIAEAHRAHAAELARVTGMPLPSASTPASAAAPATNPDATLAALRERERGGRDAATTACAAAPAERAALLASIAAARATHLEALK
ncbi:hypothetical protein C1I99_05920 [Micromonospora deserti]|uniref:DUF4439 domain-containing protein n=1 Tax=Micromonospora deserti TaxID=2070366 RepID=A0A2W2DWZ8_9ACTN|nr:hypothetical protein C1I99_05920 [Micromonospora deserti]